MIIIYIVAGLIVGLIIGFFVDKLISKSAIEKALVEEKEKLNKEKEKLNRQQENIKKKLQIDIKEEFLSWKNDYNKKQSHKQQKLNDMEKRLLVKEGNLDQRYINLDNKEKELKKQEQAVVNEKKKLADSQKKADKLIEEQTFELERIAGMTVQEAKESMRNKFEADARLEAAQKMRMIEEEQKEKSKLHAQDVISASIQRIASEYVISSAVTVIDLPSDEMKGRIIGREGRNIRALENATGVDFIVDDTPEAIIVSSFDPIRREIAKLALQELVVDGRIHPARIEEVVEKIEENFDNYLREIGENTVIELGIRDMNPELYFYLGKLKFRTSYGQNCLYHSKEVALISAFMARELGVNVSIAKRAGLLHDVGKSIDRETEGTHTQISVDLAKKYGECKEVQDAIESHHMDVPFASVEAVIVQSADSLSAARPGARREIFESYIKRLAKLEEVSKSFKGVNKAYAFRAGREVRVVVDSNELNDNKTFLMSKDIAKSVQEQLEYPGQIKVTVIREVRATEYAK